MTNDISISQITLWAFVLMLGITVGGGLYEMQVLMPLWSAAPPDSVIAFYQHKAANPQFVPDQGGRFWIFVTPFTTLLALATLLFKTSPEHRRWRIAASAIFLVVSISTFAWFVPNIMRLSSSAVTTMHGDEVTSLANSWVSLNRVRAVLLIAAWVAAMRALTIQPASVERTD